MQGETTQIPALQVFSESSCTVCCCCVVNTGKVCVKKQQKNNLFPSLYLHYSALPPVVIPASPRHTCLPPSYLPPPVIPASPRHSCSPLRHTCLSPSYLPLPVIPAPPSVIPAKAGILTRDAIYKGHAVAVNYAGKSLKVRNFLCLCALQSLVWIRALCKSRRSYPD